MGKNAVNWTWEQRQVIESRGNNLLVSAAAGSGKTAVLVERIIQMVTDRDHPVDIDHLLVMTFTNAAAAEMRERIGAAIESRLAQEPGNEHLQMQATLIHHARITTIHSFCLNIIREHFNLLDLDPSFRIAEEGELTLLKADVMAELLEDRYQNGGSRFERFVETYAQGKSDGGVEDYIMQVYTFSQSNPWPEQWLEACAEELGQERGAAWMDFLTADLKKQAGELALQMADALDCCRQDPYLAAYEPMLSQDAARLRALSGAADWKELYDRLQDFSWDRLASVRSAEVDPKTKNYVTECRKRAKKAIAHMQERYCFAPLSEMEADMKRTGETVETLLDLAGEYGRRFREKKRERNLVDFNDLEHEALKVLIRIENGKTVYTEAADELSSQFEHVLVDEYQDSNLVQETLLHAVSRERFGCHNLFMVGDVKQSIYKFRLARPELFLEKYQTYEPYGTGEGPNKKIELHRNFRSRGQVLDGINDVFFQIMTENLGGIRYTEETALHEGAQFARFGGEEERLSGEPELLMMDTGKAALSQLDETAAEYTARELEAKLIVSRIRQMTDPEKGLLVWDKRLGEYRTAQYRDMVILLRSTSGWTETFLPVLMNEGIPAYAESRMGYFNTIEVETVLSLLSVIDNPMQDIPLAAVLKSPIVGMGDQDLAEMMILWKQQAVKGQDRGVYAAMGLALQKEEWQGEPAPWLKRLCDFSALLEELRQASVSLPIHELLYLVYEKTGYYRLVSVMPAGETRRANLDMLVEKAAAYEKTSYKGLFHFVRYIENLKRYHTDFGEAAAAGEEDDTVRIMSIHKSKGLEFPVVFLAGMGKPFNRRDGYQKILIDPELGIAADYLDPEKRLKTVTLKKRALQRKMELDNLGEELRVLYVAMTRAKEKLVMTGTDRYLEASLVKYSSVPATGEGIPYTILTGAKSYLDWLLMAFGSGPVRIKRTQVPLEQVMGEELVRQIRSRDLREDLRQLDGRVWNQEIQKMLRDGLSEKYPFEADIRLYTAMSVSELKRQGQRLEPEEGEEAALTLYEPVPETGQQKDGALALSGGGAQRGSAYHRVLELLDLSAPQSLQEVADCLQALEKAGRLEERDRGMVSPELIWAFLRSDLGRRMARAQRAGKLWRERQFIMGIPACEMGAADSKELVVIQGRIDAYFEEEGSLVLADYKTDRVERAEVLREHYRGQLDYYARGLSQMTGKPVREKIIYSLALQQEIPC